ncbi:MAG TPA: hypothetical protein VKQ72_07460 [Aggregatilineales bacterium]|nr:hypothetical protein [Aggregatilineales bacterium]
MEKCYWDSNTCWHVITRPDGQVERSRLGVEAEDAIQRLTEQDWEFVEQKPIGARMLYWFRRAEQVESQTKKREFRTEETISPVAQLTATMKALGMYDGENTEAAGLAAIRLIAWCSSMPFLRRIIAVWRLLWPA